MTDEHLRALAIGAREAWIEANHLMPHLGVTEPVIYLGQRNFFAALSSARADSMLVTPGRNPDEATIMGVACVRVHNLTYQHLTWRPLAT